MLNKTFYVKSIDWDKLYNDLSLMELQERLVRYWSPLSSGGVSEDCLCALQKEYKKDKEL